jgi:hypothetical protein
MDEIETKIQTLCSLELISQNQHYFSAMEQCFSLTTNQHQQQPQIPSAE